MAMAGKNLIKMNLKNVKSSLSRDEMKMITGGATCTSDCGATCSGEVCATDRNTGGVKCRNKGQWSVTLCEVVVR
jgi:natural product precursor